MIILVPVAVYSGPCILRLLLQQQHFGLKLEVVLKSRDIYVENIGIVSLIAGLKMERNVKCRGVKSRGPLYMLESVVWHQHYSRCFIGFVGEF